MFSLIYALGLTVKALGSIPSWFGHKGMVVGTFVGLALIALGTGGIKPCVCAFGGDQIPKDKVRYVRLQTVFEKLIVFCF